MGNRNKNLGFMRTNKPLYSLYCLFNAAHCIKRTSFLRWWIQTCHPQSSISRPVKLCEQDTPALLFSCMVPIQTDKKCFSSSQNIRGSSCNNTSSHKKGVQSSGNVAAISKSQLPKVCYTPNRTHYVLWGPRRNKSRKCRNGTYYSYGCGLKQHQHKIILKLEK